MFVVAAAVTVVVLLAAGATALTLRFGAGPPHAQQNAADPASARGAARGQGAAGAAEPLGPSTSVDAPSASGALSHSTAAGASPGAGAAGGPVASDDFTGSGVDTTRWSLYSSTNSNGSSWSGAMDRVSGGELRIVASGSTSGGLCWCRSGAVRQYGVWQVRARFDPGAGYGPQLGLWPAQGTSDTNGWLTLLDISQPSRKSGLSAVHGPGGGSARGTVSGDLTAWHTYTLEWRAAHVKVSMDDTVVLDTGAAGAAVKLPTVPMFLYIQQQVGPNDHLAAPGASGQATMHIDWVRYYG